MVNQSVGSYWLCGDQGEVSQWLCHDQGEVKLWLGGELSEVSHWLSVEFETIQSVVCWWIRESSLRGLRVDQRVGGQWLGCEQERIVLLASNQ